MSLILNMIPALTRFEESVNIINRSGSYDINGRWQQDATVPTSIRAVVQPDRSRDLDNESYGSQAVGNMSFWSRSEIKPVDDDNGIPGDIIEYEGKQYKIISVRFWDKYGYYKGTGELLSGGRQGG